MNPLAADLDLVLEHTRESWEGMRGQNLFLTGGTGFFGCWLLESFCWANDGFRLGATATVLSRDPQAFAAKVPHLASHPAVRLHHGDVRSFDFPDGQYSHVIHAATAASAQFNQEAPLAMLDTIIEGTRRVLDFAVACGARKLLLTSSGAVYGAQPADVMHLPETYLGGPDVMDPGSAYGEGKRVAELLCAIYHARYGIEAKIARCFAFVGPHLPLDAHYAIGNFIADRHRGAPVRVRGDGTPRRSYMYAADLAVWLWAILFRGLPCRPYNVGSEQDLTVAEVAQMVAASGAAPQPVEILGAPTGGPRQRYAPETARAREGLSLRELTGLAEAIKRTLAWSE